MEEVREKSVAAFRGEIERALMWAPSTWCCIRAPGRDYARRGTEAGGAIDWRAIDGLPWQGTGFHILIENTAGAECSLGGNFEQVAELVERLKPCAPVGVCLDTCHTHVSGYDMVSAEGYAETMGKVAATVGFDAVRVWHCNDAKAERGSKLDRHEHIGQGTMGSFAVSPAAE